MTTTLQYSVGHMLICGHVILVCGFIYYMLELNIVLRLVLQYRHFIFIREVMGSICVASGSLGLV